LHESAKAVFTPASTALRLRTGSVPGIEASSNATEVLIGSAKLFFAPEKSLEFVAI
jgi:hypothetical protein